MPILRVPQRLRRALGRDVLLAGRLAHYLDAHAVRLPEEFVQHALSASLVQPHLPSPEFDHLGQRDRSWPGTELRGLLWTPEPPAEEYGPDVDLDPTWWLMQIGSREIR